MRGRRRRIVLIGANYWPEETGNGPYTTAYAEHLASIGNEVTVITGFPHYPSWRRRAEDRGRWYTTEERNGVRIVRVRHHVPARPGTLGRLLMEASFGLVAGVSAVMRRGDAYLGVMPTVSGGAAAAVAGAVHRAPYGLLVQDLTGRGALQSGVCKTPLVGRLVNRLETSLARRAAGTAVVAEGFRRHLAAQGVPHGAIDVLRNFQQLEDPGLDTALDIRQRAWLPGGSFVTLHSGNMGAKQGLDVLVHAAALLKDEPAYQFVLMGDGSQRDRLHSLVRELGLTNVTFLPLQPAEDVLPLLRSADLLALTQQASVTDMSLPSKLTAYFAAGRPVVASVHSDSETAALVRETGAGIVVSPDDPHGLAETIRLLRHDELGRRRFGANGRQYARDRITRESGLEAFARFVAGIIGHGDREMARRTEQSPATTTHRRTAA